MSDSPICNVSSLSPLERFKQQRAIQQKPFPLWALLAIYHTSSRQDTYCNYFEGFKLLVDWLSPIEIPHLTIEDRLKSENKIPKLFQGYEIQELATILGTTQEVIYHEYRHSLTEFELLLTSNTAFLSTQIPTEKNGSAGI